MLLDHRTDQTVTGPPDPGVHGGVEFVVKVLVGHAFDPARAQNRRSHHTGGMTLNSAALNSAAMGFNIAAIGLNTAAVGFNTAAMGFDTEGMTFAKRERQGLADALAEVGPNVATLCEGWRTRDLAAHLVLRESRPDAGLVIAADSVPILRSYATRVTRQVLNHPYDQLVAQFRSGPPMFSAFALPGADAAANTLEFFVHREDVRREPADWSPRTLAQPDRQTLWQALTRFAGLAFLRAPVAAVLRVPDGPRVRVGHGQSTVVLTGDVGELAMAVTGRHEHLATVEGPPLAVEAYRTWRR